MITVSIADDKLRLHDGISTARAIKFGILRIDKIDITVVAERYILHLYITASDVKHGKIAVSALGLTTLTRQYDILRIAGFAYNLHSVELQFHAIRSVFALQWTRNILLIGIIYPID